MSDPTGARPELPQGWAWRAIGELCSPIAKVKPEESPGKRFRYIDISSVDRRAKGIAEVREVAAANAPSRARQGVCAGDVLVSTVRPNLQAVATVPAHLDGAVASTGFCVLRGGEHLLSSWLYYWVLSPTFLESLLYKARGVSYPAVLDKDVRAEPIPVPPLDEQRRIVSILEGFRARTDEGRGSLEKCKDLLSAYRVASYVSAFSGADSSSPHEEKPLAKLATVQSGIAKGRPGNDQTAQAPYIRTANVQAGYLDLAEIKELAVTPQQLERHKLQEGDVLVLEGGDADKVGRGWLWEGQIEDCLHQNHVFAVRPTGPLQPRFLAHYINAPQARGYFLSVAKQTTNLASINKSNLRALPIPVLEPDQQEAVVAELELGLGAAEGMEEGINAAERKLQAMDRAILDRAFRGQIRERPEELLAGW